MIANPIDDYLPHRKLGITTQNETDLILARRVKKISYEVPSTFLQQKYLHDIESGVSRPLSPNTLSKRKPLVSFIDNFTMKQYTLTKPKRILIKDRDFLHLLGEVNGSKYNYCSRPELEILVIGMETRKYYDQVFHQEMARDTVSRPRSAYRPRSATMMMNPSNRVIPITPTATQTESKVEETKVEETKAEETKILDIDKSASATPVNDGPICPANIVPHVLSELSFNLLDILPLNSLAVVHGNQRYLTLLYDPAKNLVILSEKMEVELIQLMLACHQDFLKRKQEYEEKLRPNSAPAVVAATPSVATKSRPNSKHRDDVRPKTPKTVSTPSSAKNRLGSPNKEKRDNNAKSTSRKTVARQKTAGKLSDSDTDREKEKKKGGRGGGGVTDSSDQEESGGHSARFPAVVRVNTDNELIADQVIEEEVKESTAEAVVDPTTLKPPEKKELILLQSFYYVGNEDIFYTLDVEKVRYWKRFYAYYLLPFFESYLDAYSHQYNFISSMLSERMTQIDHHIELNQNRTILEDSQSEESDNDSVGLIEKKGKKLRKQATMHKKKRNSIINTSSGSISDLLTSGITATSTAAPNAAVSSSEDEQGDGRAEIVRRNNIKPIFIPKEKQASKKMNLLASNNKASSSSLMGNDK